GANTGSILVEINGGIEPYEVLHSGLYLDRPLVKDLSSGEYTFITEDANGCLDTVHVELRSPPELQAMLSFLPSTCNDDESGQIVADSVWGGIGPYEIQLNGSDFIPLQPFSDIQVGEHEVSIRDENGCKIELTGITRPAQIPIISLPEKI